MILDVTLSPDLLPRSFAGSLCTVIDVLRATTTIITALASGASEVHPCISAAEARRCAEAIGHKSYLLGGEKGGLRIPGFHLGNSPIEYLDSGKIAGKIIYFATTNGTPALRRAYKVSTNPVYLAALVNLSAVSSAIIRAITGNSLTKICLICAGRYGKPSLEDFLCAGLILPPVQDGLLQSGITCQLSDAASIAIEFSKLNKEKPLEVLAASEHGQYLQRIGFAADLKFASQIDKYQIVPIFDGSRITVSP